MEQNKYPPHLSEFFSIVNNKDKEPTKSVQDNNLTGLSNSHDSFSGDPNARLSTPQPHHRYNNSISSSLNSNSSCLANLDMIITSKDIEQLTKSLTQLKNVSLRYSKSLESLAQDTLEFSNIINDLTQLKICPNDNKIIKNLLDSSGLFQIITNHHLILANSINTYLVTHLTNLIGKIDNYYNSTHNKFIEFDQLQSNKLNQLKRDYYHSNKSKPVKNNNRFDDNLIQIRQNLNDLQFQVNEMELNRFNYYQDLIHFNDTVFNDVINKLATISKMHLEISENIARKNWPDGGLDQLLNYSDDILYTKDNMREEEDEPVNGEVLEENHTSNESADASATINNSREEEDEEEDNTNTTPTLSLPKDQITTSSPHKRNDSKTSYFSIDNNQISSNDNQTSSESVEYDEEQDQSFSLPLTMTSPSQDNDNDTNTNTTNNNISDNESNNIPLSPIVSQTSAHHDTHNNNHGTFIDQSSI